MKATPELEDFGYKYTETGKIGELLLNQYFKAVYKLQSKIEKEIESAHEIGCGEGFSTKRLRDMLPKTAMLTASEYVHENVEKAKAMNPDLDIFQEDIYNLKYEDDKIDLIYLLEVLEHLDYPDRALKEVKRVSSKYLILGVPKEPLWRILNLARGKYIKDFGNTPGHLNHWSGRGLKRFIEKHYGEVIAVQNPVPWTIVLAKKNSDNENQ